MNTAPFDYAEAFNRNLGWLTAADQEKLRASCVAIAGLGGAGGYQAQALARLGVGAFKLADPDTFELSNINRQTGATVHTLGRMKTEVTRDMLLAINPGIRIEIFAQGINPENTDRFLDGADLAIDGIDFFSPDVKCLLFERAWQKKVTALTSCPLGFGASLLVFGPQKGMRYDDYFDFKPGMTQHQKLIAFMFGLSPVPLCLNYKTEAAVGFDAGRAASTSAGLMLVGAVSAAEAVKILTGRGRVCCAPHIFQVDLRTQQVRRKFYRYGMRSPWQRLKKWVLARLIDRPEHPPPQ